MLAIAHQMLNDLAHTVHYGEVAEAVVAAVQRLYLPPDQDAQTGFLRIPELRADSRG